MESLANTILTIAVIGKFLPKDSTDSTDDLTSLVIPIALIDSLQGGGMGGAMGGAGTSATGSGDQLSSLLTTIIALSFLPKQESTGSITG
jgi:hypothetical protein